MMESGSKSPLVIVGAGLAGLRVAEGARHAGFAGRILLISDELHAPYDRPPLSKAVLLNEGHEHEIALATVDGLEAAAIELRLGQGVTGIDRAGRSIELGTGERLAYDTLVLATGSRVREMQSLPMGAPGVFYMRTLDDALGLRAALATATRIAIVGGGVIGMEIAAVAAAGRSVTVIEAQPQVMARAASRPVSDFLEQRHRQAGVNLRLGVTVTEAQSASDGRWTLTLSDGSRVQADVVVVGIGVVPNVELAQRAGLEVGFGGIVTDAFGRTSDPHIFAAGEVALHFNTLHGRHDRQETWAHAAAHGEHVGRSLVAAGAGYAERGSYWSDQYDINLQVFGTPIGEIDVVRGDIAAGRFVVFHILSGLIVGVSGVNAVRELRAARKLLGLAAPNDLSELADASAPLKAAA